MMQLLLPVPGLRARFLPVSVAIVACGLLFEAASVALAIWARHTLGRYWSGTVRLAADQELIREGP
jgi:protein-S-isoprenylcysteine O-methyltransferase Ste14